VRYLLHTPQEPPCLAQCLQYLQFLQALQFLAPVQVAAWGFTGAISLYGLLKSSCETLNLDASLRIISLDNPRR
jgi:hypothetical protein